jgi:endonuclease IV
LQQLYMVWCTSTTTSIHELLLTMEERFNDVIQYSSRLCCTMVCSDTCYVFAEKHDIENKAIHAKEQQDSRNTLILLVDCTHSFVC